MGEDYIIRRIRCLNPCDIKSAMSQAGIFYQNIDINNWKQFVADADVRFAAAHNGREILVHYVVEEPVSRAVADVDGGRVWEDSCAEMFIRPESDSEYYNIECNCIGTIHMAHGKDRFERRILAPEDTARIGRWTSLERIVFENTATGKWELALAIPMDLINVDPKQKAFCNFYSCGDRLPQPHYLSWKPISTKEPDFHRPEFFYPVKFE